MSELQIHALTVGERIRARREELDLSMSDVARALETSHVNVRNWELGTHDLKFTQAVRLARVLSVSVEWFAEGVEITNTLAEIDEGVSIARPKGFEPLTFWSVVHASYTAAELATLELAFIG